MFTKYYPYRIVNIFEVRVTVCLTATLFLFFDIELRFFFHDYSEALL